MASVLRIFQQAAWQNPAGNFHNVPFLAGKTRRVRGAELASDKRALSVIITATEPGRPGICHSVQHTSPPPLF
ncbi:MAG: hypothetical protein NZ789_09340, partial [Pseudomonadales bacterium]|nr:hypothetical protein [Pseudomonadales bacterium]